MQMLLMIKPASAGFFTPEICVYGLTIRALKTLIISFYRYTV
ncbi:hypothetical protein CKO_01891 [Citrobacter koseri ATCC BAA-895]|uniref:Uncharacterized protein n=1 Tax=Citrobacter koseri (strain ATCC BAA-895 / CDC 4225-83 / SGSC4696) TaxID=290338 RepID=A8AHQ5_CITK8|nr:hypothetical protein CKO_01891 [Citrobacter koseri ATCC BAA-895]